MKRLFTALLLTFTVATGFANTNTNTNNGGVNASFRKDFKQAELLATDAGVRSVETILGRIAYGVYS